MDCSSDVKGYGDFVQEGGGEHCPVNLMIHGLLLCMSIAMNAGCIANALYQLKTAQANTGSSIKQILETDSTKLTNVKLLKLHIICIIFSIVKLALGVINVGIGSDIAVTILFLPIPFLVQTNLRYIENGWKTTLSKMAKFTQDAMPTDPTQLQKIAGTAGQVLPSVVCVVMLFVDDKSSMQSYLFNGFLIVGIIAVWQRMWVLWQFGIELMSKIQSVIDSASGGGDSKSGSKDASKNNSKSSDNTSSLENTASPMVAVNMSSLNNNSTNNNTKRKSNLSNPSLQIPESSRARATVTTTGVGEGSVSSGRGALPRGSFSNSVAVSAAMTSDSKTSQTSVRSTSKGRNADRFVSAKARFNDFMKLLPFMAVLSLVFLAVSFVPIIAAVASYWVVFNITSLVPVAIYVNVQRLYSKASKNNTNQSESNSSSSVEQSKLFSRDATRARADYTVPA